ncbi:hypothetical protein appser2_11810 [Actinobacillus pleuropneumoniae serovar 2 str. S1536]|nr:hypothetical protein appser2_11810 [Actinobacillus pleuropneumoniae serovar 2 str. S1536]
MTPIYGYCANKRSIFFKNLPAVLLCVVRGFSVIKGKQSG